MNVIAAGDVSQYVAPAFKAPEFGERRKAMLQDIAILTGGQVISEDVGLTLDGVTLDLLGRTRKVTITKDNTTIVGGNGADEDIQGRIRQIKTRSTTPTRTGPARSCVTCRRVPGVAGCRGQLTLAGVGVVAVHPQWSHPF